MAELGVLGGGEGFEDGPLVEEHFLDLLDAGEDFEAGLEVVGLDEVDGGAELVDHELHPELGGLVLDDEEELVVVLGGGEGALRGEDLR